ncbi:hypothetical protein [Riemerella anatipestifer]|uniref:Uncharacterized protein n=1 Tax=Riemerella anatipestifer TaxID=34085 RepID=A0A1S7DQF6_RIEAN|nr:hypothetical protein [Riemerella anatipestifer]UXN81002.1 hypothetical protein [Phage vB_RanS_PJN03]AQY21345.1 hypothetical protein AB406_0386 [Riemerella anatipestifer]MRM83371.1 hypothetical protein [Riemerella anatipestifer]MSN81955.1 hypothetical protein [Riemerella anatipestifer]NAV16686.1 hypothetical protein [Riemerella anatipestifer]
MSKAEKLIKNISQRISDLKSKESELKAKLLSNFYGYFDVYSEDLLKTQVLIGEYERTLNYISVADSSIIEKYLLERRQVILNSLMEDKLSGISSNQYYNLKYISTIEVNRKIAYELYNWLSILK